MNEKQVAKALVKMAGELLTEEEEVVSVSPTTPPPLASVTVPCALLVPGRDSYRLC